ncbi:MAG: WG repeat-containing protein [Dysgonomonas sp.]
MKRLSILLLLLLFFFSVSAQDKPYQLINLDGKVLSEYEYLELPSHTAAYGAIAKKGDKYALLDSLGIPCTSFIYDKIKYKNDKELLSELIAVQEEGKWGAVNYKGEEVIPLTYDKHIINIGKFIEFIKDNIVYTLNNKGEIISSNRYIGIYDNGCFGYTNEGNKKKGLITYLGKEVALPDSIKEIRTDYGTKFIPGVEAFMLNEKKTIVVDSLANILFRDVYVSRFKEDHTVTMIGGDDEKTGLIDNTGKLIVPIESTYDSERWGQLRWNYSVHSGFIFYIGGKYYFYDKDGQLKISGADKIEGLEELKQLRVYIGNNVQMYDASGNPIAEPKKEPANTGNWVKFTDNKGRSGYKDKDGNITIPSDYDYISGFSYGHAVVKKKRKYGLIDRNNNITIPIKYNYIDDLKADNVCMIKKGNDAFFTDFQGNLIGKVYRDIWQLMRVDSLRYAAYDSEGFPMLLDGNAHPITAENKYTYMSPNPLYEGKLEVARPGGKGLLDAVSGQEVVPCRYQSIRAFEGLDNAYLVKSKDAYGLVRSGEEIIPCQFEEIKYLKGNLLTIKVDGLWGVINLQGTFVIPAKYESLSYFSSNILIAVKGYSE